MLDGKRVLLVIAGGIAAFKCADLIRRLRERGAAVRCVLTESGARFMTPLTLQALTEDKVYGELFSLTDESEMGHIQLSRSADLVVVAPATANLMAKMAHGMADDLASTVLLATDKRVLVAPSMNVRMWTHAATQANVRTLIERGVSLVGPNDGAMACGEFGPGRMAEPVEIMAAIETLLAETSLIDATPRLAHARGLIAPPEGRPLAGFRALVTSGPTREPIDPVRYISNHSSGKQGHAIAAALAQAGAQVTLVTGPVSQPDPLGAVVVRVETAREMLEACERALPADIAVCAAAVADWRVTNANGAKLKKKPGAPPPPIELTPNPDILATLSADGPSRPRLVIGFAAETENVAANARDKRKRKNCDWIVANDVSPATGTFGGDRNTVHLISAEGEERWPTLGKDEVAARLVARIAEALLRPSGAGKAAE
jgi:phosphopantothenoylcysteine decarboxylase/phosphopantothenate--cysteine ligase